MNPVERGIKEQLEALGFRVLRNGWPDFLCIRKVPKMRCGTDMHGEPVFGETYGLCAVEVKARGDKVSEVQAQMHKALRSVGIPVFIMGNGADPKLKVKHYLTNRDIQHLKDAALAARKEIESLQAQIDHKQRKVDRLLATVDECSLVLDDSVAALEEPEHPFVTRKGSLTSGCETEEIAAQQLAAQAAQVSSDEMARAEFALVNGGV